MSAKRPTHGYCPACEQSSPIDAGQRCLFCGEDATVYVRVRRRRGKRRGVWGKLTDDQLRVLHRLHTERDVAIREMARAGWEQWGYASEGSAVEGIRHGWRRLKLPARPRVEATSLSNRRRRTPGSPGTEDRRAYKRWLRLVAGGYRPCQGVKLQPPEKGRPCRQNAAPGSDYCWQHDPARRAEVAELMAAMRERLPEREAIAA